MASVFTREGNFGVMRNSATGEIIVSSEKATIKSIGSSIGIWFGSANYSTSLSDIDTIAGVPPLGIEDAVFKLADIFKGCNTTITTC